LHSLAVQLTEPPVGVAHCLHVGPQAWMSPSGLQLLSGQTCSPVMHTDAQLSWGRKQVFVFRQSVVAGGHEAIHDEPSHRAEPPPGARHGLQSLPQAAISLATQAPEQRCIGGTQSLGPSDCVLVPSIASPLASTESGSVRPTSLFESSVVPAASRPPAPPLPPSREPPALRPSAAIASWPGLEEVGSTETPPPSSWPEGRGSSRGVLQAAMARAMPTRKRQRVRLTR
jgi:hypothetical protein